MNTIVKKLATKTSTPVLLSIAVLAAGLTATYLLDSPSAHAAPAPMGSFVTLLFSRSEITASDNCTENDTNIARLDTTVAPFLQSLGFSATGTLETAKTPDGPGAYFCTHFGDTLTASWSDATNLAQNFGWSFGSHTADYPAHMSTLNTAQQNAETCGSAATLDAHNLPGSHGIIAYPGGQTFPTAMQTNYGDQCFAWARHTGNKGITSLPSAAKKVPYIERAEGVNGGACNDPAAACYSYTNTLAPNRYTDPNTIIGQINALKPGQWLTFEAYVLVTNSNIAPNSIYSKNATQWDCTSSSPEDHWTNDEERYCYVDYQAIINAISTDNQNAAANGTTPVTVTDPLTVGEASGRPNTY